MITRRKIIAGISAAPFIRPLSALAADTDVVIIGAGAAGLSAAKTLRENGASFKILEAKGRIGGRTHTIDGQYDAGAAYVHFADKFSPVQNPWVNIAEDLKIELTPFFFGGGFRFTNFENNRQIPPLQSAFLQYNSAKMRSIIDDYDDYNDTSFAQLAHKKLGEDGVRAVRSTTLFALGDEPHSISVQDYNSLLGGSNMTVTGGYGTLVAKYGADVPVILNTPVSKIDTTQKLVSITTSQGIIRSKAVIITVSIGVLKAGGIEFAPRLSASHQRALDGMFMGALTKIGLQTTGNLADFDNNRFIRDQDNKNVISFDVLPNNKPVIVAVTGGDLARDLTKNGETAAVNHLKDRLVALFGEKVRALIPSGQLHGWAGDDYAKGSYALIKPGHFEARNLIRQPITERAYFAGEATALSAAMTVGGASLEGIRVANLLTSRLKIEQ